MISLNAAPDHIGTPISGGDGGLGVAVIETLPILTPSHQTLQHSPAKNEGNDFHTDHDRQTHDDERRDSRTITSMLAETRDRRRETGRRDRSVGSAGCLVIDEGS